MKSKNKSFYAHGNEHKTPKPSKHDANLQKNSVLHFQIGLLIGLIVTFFVLQIALKPLPVPNRDVAEIIKDDQVYVMPPKVLREEPNQKEVKKKVTKIIDEIIKVDDKKDFVDTQKELLTPEEPKGDPNLNIGNINYVPVEKEVGPIRFEKVELVPVFPGCEDLSTNEERKECMSEKIDRLVRKNFNASKATDYGITGVQRIYVQFKINKQGLVSDVEIRTPHKVLEDEARRVTGLIPQMKPGRQRSQDVEVVFMKPIVFKVQ